VNLFSLECAVSFVLRFFDGCGFILEADFEFYLILDINFHQKVGLGKIISRS
jgi:hypothetical protein